MDQKDIVFSKNVVEFITVGVEYCHFIENASTLSNAEFIDRAAKILPLLYLKASLLPECNALGDDSIEESVTEEQYAHIAFTISSLLKENDDYLETFHPDMQFSDTPVLASISEDLSDIYQDTKNFAYVYSIGHEPSMYDALCICKENFASFWGQKLVNAMGAIHSLRFNLDFENEPDDTNNVSHFLI